MEIHQSRKFPPLQVASRADAKRDKNYQGETGKTIDELWGLTDLKNRTPAWHAYYIPGADGAGNGKAGDSALVPTSGTTKQPGKTAGKKPLAITNGDESDTSMPSLQTVSNSSEEEMDFDSDSDDSGDEYETDSDEDDDDEFDEELEEELREMIRDAMDVAQADPDFHDPRSSAKFFEDMAADKKDNPFLKLLGSLRGETICGHGTFKVME